MAYKEPGRIRTKIGAAAMVVLFVAAGVLTVMGYTAAFTPTDTVTVMAPRAGLVTERDAKVRYRGLQVGRIGAIDFDGDQARLTLRINRSYMRYIPSDSTVRIGGNTVFGAKSVQFLPPESPSATSLQPGATVQASAVQVEVNTLFQALYQLLQKIDPVNLSAAVTALGEGLRGNGDNLGAALEGLNTLMDEVNPKLPRLHEAVRELVPLSDVLASASPDLVRVFDNMPSLSNTLVSQQDNLTATLLAATGLANNGYETLAPAADDLVATIQRLRAPLKVTGEYSPVFPCLLQGIAFAVDKFAPIIGGIRPGLYVSSSFIPGAPAYTYPESLPIVNATGGPNCRGLPNVPSKQLGGSWYRTPFLVTDNAYVPYEPNTEVQFDAPSTLQFLFNGAFAERDDY